MTWSPLIHLFGGNFNGFQKFPKDLASAIAERQQAGAEPNTKTVDDLWNVVAPRIAETLTVPNMDPKEVADRYDRALQVNRIIMNGFANITVLEAEAAKEIPYTKAVQRAQSK